MLPYGRVDQPNRPQYIGPFTRAIASGTGGVTVTVSTRVSVVLTVSYRVTYTVSTRVVTTSPGDSFEIGIRCDDVVRRSRVVSCVCCAANVLAATVSAAARPSAQVVM